MDEAAVRSEPGSGCVGPWTGRLQRVRPDGRYVLITRSGYEWPVAPVDARAATSQERAAYDGCCLAAYRRGRVS